MTSDWITTWLINIQVVAEQIGNEVERSSLLPVYCRFRRQSTFNKVDRVEFNFVASVYPA